MSLMDVLRRRDPNVARHGSTYALTVITPIRPGADEELRRALSELGAEGESPFAKVPETHFARLVVLGRLPYEGPPRREPTLPVPLLLFSCVVDGDPDSYLEEMCRQIPGTVDLIWGRCAGAPARPASVPGTFRAWMRGHQVQTKAFFAAYAPATVGEVRAALQTRRRVRELAERTQYLPPDRLRAAVIEAFPAGEPCDPA
jgi:hypothetical protein